MIILTSNDFRAGGIKEIRDQKEKKNLCALCLSASLREIYGMVVNLESTTKETEQE